MGIAKLYGQSKGTSGFKINGIIQDYYVVSGATVKKGDFVEIINETQVQKATTSQIYGVAKTSGTGGNKISVYVVSSGNYVMADGKIFATSDGKVFLLKEG